MGLSAKKIGVNHVPGQFVNYVMLDSAQRPYEARQNYYGLRHVGQ